jgi:hypothetical protein
LVGYVGMVYYWVYHNTTLFEQDMGGGQTMKFNCFLDVEHISHNVPFSISQRPHHVPIISHTMVSQPQMFLILVVGYYIPLYI